MARRRSWFHFVRKFFIADTKGKPEKKEKRRWFLGRFKLKCLPPVLVPSHKQRTLREAEDDHKKHALTVAIATAAAAEAAVAAAQAAAEVLRLTGASQSYRRTKSRRWNPAAIVIQTAFRGYLARKALRALKGLVKLQAIIRGQAVRRRVLTSLKRSEPLSKIQQSHTRERRFVVVKDSRINEDDEPSFRPNKDMIGFNTQKKRIEDPPSLLERCNSIILSRQGSLTRRTHEKTSDFVLRSYPSYREIERRSERKITELSDEEQFTGLRSTAISLPRRSFSSSSSSSSTRNYMLTTESAKAKTRSISIPKQRYGYSDSSYSDSGFSPSKNRLSFSSMSADFGVPSKTLKTSSSQPRIKSLGVPMNIQKNFELSTH